MPTHISRGNVLIPCGYLRGNWFLLDAAVPGRAPKAKVTIAWMHHKGTSKVVLPLPLHAQQGCYDWRCAINHQATT
jgi:hypothetical protein